MNIPTELVSIYFKKMELHRRLHNSGRWISRMVRMILEFIILNLKIDFITMGSLWPLSLVLTDLVIQDLQSEC